MTTITWNVNICFVRSSNFHLHILNCCQFLQLLCKTFLISKILGSYNNIYAGNTLIYRKMEEMRRSNQELWRWRQRNFKNHNFAIRHTWSKLFSSRPNETFSSPNTFWLWTWRSITKTCNRCRTLINLFRKWI